VQEVVLRLTDSNATSFEVSVEIAAPRFEGFDEAVVRTVSEIAGTLRFKDRGFEDEWSPGQTAGPEGCYTVALDYEHMFGTAIGTGKGRR
jgi:hypothetical protein